MSADEIDPRVQRVARRIAESEMPAGMQRAPRVTQALYIDAVWMKHVAAARAALDEAARVLDEQRAEFERKLP